MMLCAARSVALCLPSGSGNLSGFTAFNQRAALDPLSLLNATDRLWAFTGQRCQVLRPLCQDPTPL